MELERHSRDPKANPGNRSEDPEPHHTLNNPASDPDPPDFDELKPSKGDESER
jgi:hypothetical protein